jgi:hypothetical protein
VVSIVVKRCDGELGGWFLFQLQLLAYSTVGYRHLVWVCQDALGLFDIDLVFKLFEESEILYGTKAATSLPRRRSTIRS